MLAVVMAAPNAGAVPAAVGGGALHDVVAIGPADVWAVGSAGTVAHWDGATWSTAALGGLRVPNLTGVDASSPTDVWVVGGVVAYERRRAWIGHWDGAAWTRFPAPSVKDEVRLGDVAVASSTDAWAVGSIYRSSFGDGRVGPIVLHWNGTRWSRVRAPVGVALTGVAASEGRVLTVGSRARSPFPLVIRRVDDGWRETQVAFPSGWRCALADVTASPPAAVGTCRRPGSVPRPYAVQRYSEGVWGNGVTRGRGALLGIDGGQASWAVGRERPSDRPLILRRRPDDTWTRVGAPHLSAGGLEAVSSRTFADAWAVGWQRTGGGRAPLALRWVGSSWTTVPFP